MRSAVMLLCALTAVAQSPTSPHAGGNDPHLPQPASRADAMSAGPQLSTQDSPEVKMRHFSTPGVPDQLSKYTTFKSDYFSVRFGLVALVDYDAFSQDADSIKQVGKQRDQWDDRSFRFLLSGDFGPKSYQMHYLAEYSFNGFDAPENRQKTWNFPDLNLTLPAGKLGAFVVGKTKEYFSYEMTGDATFLPHQERVLNPFFTSRNIGIALKNHAFHKRVLYSAGWFNDWWATNQSFNDSSNHFSARVSGLVSSSDDGSRYLHVGAAGRYTGATNGTIRLSGKPESNVTSNYVDTGKIPASNQKELAIEGLWTHDGYSVTTEYIRSWVNATQAANPSFYGFYATAGWMLTGEHRPYDSNVGYARRPIATHRLGAVELTARYSRLDLDDKTVNGGVMDKGTLGVNWYPNRFWKLGVDGGIVNLSKSNLNGETSMFQARLQFFY